MSKKRDDLEAIADLLYEWAVEHGEPYADVYVRNVPGRNIALTSTDKDSPDYDEMDIFKKYETPAAGTARESV